MRLHASILALLGLANAALAAGPVVIAHRGASGYVAEHTLAAYAMAHAMEADFIEPDLVLTKDKILICLHDIHLEATTNVEEIFPERKREDKRWYAADFTLAEIRQLTAHERMAARYPATATGLGVPTFEEMIQLVQGLNTSRGRNAGIYPELKAPTWHNQSGLPIEEIFLETVKKYGYDGPQANIFVQSFEPNCLLKLRNELGCNLPMIQLIADHLAMANMVSDAGLDAIAKYANGIGPDLSLLAKNPDLVQRAHARKLAVHPYTLRIDALPAKKTDATAALNWIFTESGVDGLFTDHPDAVVHFLKQTK